MIALIKMIKEMKMIIKYLRNKNDHTIIKVIPYLIIQIHSNLSDNKLSNSNNLWKIFLSMTVTIKSLQVISMTSLHIIN